MNFDRYRFRDRLRRLEVRAATSSLDDDADRRERQRLLQLTVDDPAALEAYNDWLVSITDFSQSERCVHGRGYCRSCLAQDDEVQAAWRAYEQRLHVFTQSPTPNTKEQT